MRTVALGCVVVSFSQRSKPTKGKGLRNEAQYRELLDRLQLPPPPPFFRISAQKRLQNALFFGVGRREMGPQPDDPYRSIAVKIQDLLTYF